MALGHETESGARLVPVGSEATEDHATPFQVMYEPSDDTAMQKLADEQETDNSDASRRPTYGALHVPSW